MEVIVTAAKVKAYKSMLGKRKLSKTSSFAMKKVKSGVNNYTLFAYSRWEKMFSF